TFRIILDSQYDRGGQYKIDGEHIPESVAVFRGLPVEQRGTIKLLTGHMPFGLHAFLPGPSEYVTFLRAPVERVLSHYSFVLRQPTHYLYEKVACQKMPLRDYALGGVAAELDNGQTRYLAGALDLPVGQCTRKHLEEAKRNLDTYCAVVGLVERFDESLLLA